MCKLLINRGCRIDIVDKKKKAPATYARTNHHTHIVDYLNTFKKEKEKEKLKLSNS
jgi:hypothetical protein